MSSGNLRRLISDLLVIRLRDATLASERVYAGRVAPWDVSEMPGIAVYLRKETADPDEDFSAAGFSGYVRRSLMVEVEGVSPAYQDPSNQEAGDTFAGDAYAMAHDLSHDVEAMLESWLIPGLESAELRYVGSETLVEESGGMPFAIVRTSFRLRYFTPWRDCTDPYIDPTLGIPERSGAYPGGQVLPGCPPSQIGEVCPLPGDQVNITWQTNVNSTPNLFP